MAILEPHYSAECIVILYTWTSATTSATPTTQGSLYSYSDRFTSTLKMSLMYLVYKKMSVRVFSDDVAINRIISHDLWHYFQAAQDGQSPGVRTLTCPRSAEPELENPRL